MGESSDNYYDIALKGTRSSSVSRSQVQQQLAQQSGSSPSYQPNTSQLHDYNNLSSVSLHSISSVGSLASSSAVSLGSVTKKNGPRRVGSFSSLPTLNEGKRPGDYYIQRLSSSKQLSLTPAPVVSNSACRRPVSGDSIASLQSTASEDNSSFASSHFEASNTHPPESRLSSLTSNSIMNPSPAESPSINTFSFNGVASTDNLDFNIPEMCFEEERDASHDDDFDVHRNTSVSTLTTSSPKPNRTATASASVADSKLATQSTSNLSTTSPSRPLLRSSSTSQIVKKPGYFSGSLNRSKSRFLSSKEAKERQQMRKKKYDDFDNDDDLLLDDMDSLVFNVPVIKNSELYINTGGFHNDLMTTALKPTTTTTTTSSASSSSSIASSTSGTSVKVPVPSTSKFSLAEESISEEPEYLAYMQQQSKPASLKDFDHSLEDDSTITGSITNFYNQRSTSVSKMMKLSREQQMVYRLPNYVKSQTSMEDLNLISIEKLSMIDQTRPINLPPKTGTDKSKHNREFQKVLTNYELNTKSMMDTRKKSTQHHILNYQNWLKTIEGILVENDSAKQFNKRFNYEKNNIRKLAWESNIPSSHRFEFLMKILRSNGGETDTLEGRNSFDGLQVIYSNLSKPIRSNKDVEFNKIIDLALQRPLFESILAQLSEAGGFSTIKFHENFKYLLYIKSLSESGLRKHDENFLIPVFLLLFQNTQPLKEIYHLIELMNQQVLTSEFLDTLNKDLQNWNDVNKSYSVSNHLYKFMSKYNDVSEFDNLNSNIVFEMILQVNDKLPLSLSAPTTPILSQSQFNFSSASIGQMPLAMSPLQAGAHSGPGSIAYTSSGSASDLSFNNISPRTSHTSLDELTHYVDANSSSLQLALRLIQLLVVYSNSPKSKNKNNSKVFQTFLMTTIKNYHLNWNNLSDLLKHNKSIRLNHSADQVANLDSFVEKWKDCFKRF